MFYYAVCPKHKKKKSGRDLIFMVRIIAFNFGVEKKTQGVLCTDGSRLVKEKERDGGGCNSCSCESTREV